MSDEKNNHQITRKDAKDCFVESLNDSFAFGKIHLVFATYDLSRPSGQRQTNNINIYIGVGEFLEVCRKISCGEFRYNIQTKKQKGDSTPLFESLGGTSAEKLNQLGHPRSDGKSLSRTVKIVAGKQSDVLFIADSGPGETNSKGLIVPKFGNKPENHVAVSMKFETLSELFLLTEAHYKAWLNVMYLAKAQNISSK